MKHFTVQDISTLRAHRRNSMAFNDLVSLYARVGFSRDAVVEAWWATISFDDDREAYKSANGAIAIQGTGIPLVNGKPADNVFRGFRGFRAAVPARYRPMF